MENLKSGVLETFQCQEGFASKRSGGFINVKSCVARLLFKEHDIDIVMSALQKELALVRNNLPLLRSFESPAQSFDYTRRWEQANDRQLVAFILRLQRNSTDIAGVLIANNLSKFHGVIPVFSFFSQAFDFILSGR